MQKYRPGLDGLRALAIVGVLLYHAGIRWMPGGLLGVDLFFVISGFLITSLLIAELQRSGRIAIATFYGRRARRLLPALAILLVVTATAIVVFRPHELSRFRGDLGASLGYVTNWWFILRHQSYFVATGRPSPFQHLWSLAVEEQFYLLWPLGILVLWRRLNDHKRLLRIGIIALAGACASAGLMAGLAILHNLPYGADSSRVYFGTDTHASGLLLGVAAAAFVAHRWGAFWRRRPGRLASAAIDAVGVGALAALCWAMVRTSEFSPGLYRGGFLAFSVVAAVAVVAVSRPGSSLGAVLGLKPIRWVATRSYALYLWHWPVFVYTRPRLDLPFAGNADVALRLFLTVALTEASYRLVEHPIRTMGFRVWLGRIRPHVAAAGARLRSAGSEARRHPLGSSVIPGENPTTAPLRPAMLLPAAAAAPRRPMGGPSLLRRAARAARTAPPWQPAVAAWTLAAMVFVLGYASSRSGTSTAPRRPAAARPISHVASRAAPPKSFRTAPDPKQGPKPADPPAPAPAAAPAASASPEAPPASASPAPPAAPASGTITAVGDSVMLGAVDSLKQALPGANVNAIEGRQASGAFTLLDGLVAGGHLQGDVILHTGTNGTIDPRALDLLLSRLADRRVIVLNDHVPRPWQDLNNRILTAAAHNHANVRLVDWDAAATAHPEWLWNDGIHLRPNGAAAYRDLVMATLR